MPDQVTDPTGVGGKNREAKTMEYVDEAVGGPAHPAATPSSPTQTKMKPVTKPSSFVPSGDNGPRVYGSPIEGNAASK